MESILGEQFLRSYTYNIYKPRVRLWVLNTYLVVPSQATVKGRNLSHSHSVSRGLSDKVKVKSKSKSNDKRYN